MISGKQKAQLLLAYLGPVGKNVLQKLSAESATFLTSHVENVATGDPALLSAIYEEVEEKLTESPADSFAQTQQEDEEVYSDFGDEASPSEPETAPAIAAGYNFRQMASLLTHEKPQIIAFSLSKMEESLRNNIIECLPDDVRQDVERRSIEAIPLSDKVFDSIWAKLTSVN